MLDGVTDETQKGPSREVHHGDAVAYLSAHVGGANVSVVTSMPDVSETSLDMAAWRVFFEDAARACLRATSPAGVTVFFQTDLKVEGHWVSKSHLVMRAAEAEGVPMLWHKIVCRREVGRIVHGRPGFSHLLAFSREVRDDASRATPDVLPDLGDMPWSHSMGTRAADLAMRFIRTHAPGTTTVLVPFCGIGTALAIANGHGYDAVGIERNKKRAALARTLTLPAFTTGR